MEELTLKEIQSESFDILRKVKEICEENQINYFLYYGTLLGAVRHKGFIPWDDDIDVAMPRQDYERFLQYCRDNSESIKPLELIHFTTCKDYVFSIARLSDSRYNSDYSNTKDYGLGLFVDLYPVDGFDDNDVKHAKKIKRMVRKIYYLGCKKPVMSSSGIKNLFKRLYFVYVRMFSLNKLLRKFDKLSQKYKFETGPRRKIIWDGRVSFDMDQFESFTQVDFEGEKFSVPAQYDKVLTMLYGDYMKLPPEEARVGHHYYKIWRKAETKEK